MKKQKILLVFLLIMLLTGCGKEEKQIAEGLESKQEAMQENAEELERKTTPEKVLETVRVLVKEVVDMHSSSATEDIKGADEEPIDEFPVVYMYPLYAKFLNGEIKVANPFTQGMEGYNQELGFFDEEEYDGAFGDAEKTYALQDMNGDEKEELIFRIENRPSILIYILGIVDGELICFDVFETHTSQMAFVVYENGFVWRGDFDGEGYYTYDSKGNAGETVTANADELREEDSWKRVTWTACDEVIIEEVSQVAIDYYAFEEMMAEEEWQAFSEYLPVLEEEATFHWTTGWDWMQRGEVNIRDYYASALPRFDGEPGFKYKIEEIAIIDLDDDGTKEVVLEGLYPGGHFLILHKEGEEFYGIDFVYRGFLSLQQNGVYTGSGGAGSNRLKKLAFKDGVFVETVLGWMDNLVYYIGDKEVDYDTLMKWWDEMHVGDVKWYTPVYIEL